MDDLKNKLNPLIKKYYFKKIIASFVDLAILFGVFAIIILSVSKFIVIIHLEKYLGIAFFIFIMVFFIRIFIIRPKEEEYLKYFDSLGLKERLQTFTQTDKEPFKSLILEDILNNIDKIDIKSKINIKIDKKKIQFFLIVFFLSVVLIFLKTDIVNKRDSLIDFQKNAIENIESIKKSENMILNEEDISDVNKEKLTDSIKKLEKSIKKIDGYEIEKDMLKTKEILKKIEKDFKSNKVSEKLDGDKSLLKSEAVENADKDFKKSDLKNEISNVEGEISKLNKELDKSDLKDENKKSDEFSEAKKAQSEET